MTLYHRQYGDDGPPLIILHGLLGESGNWHTLSRKVFSKHFRVFAVDQRNHGRSPHYEEIDYPVMAVDLEAFMDEQDLGKATILGHSMGGKTAMQFAATYPERVDRLVVVDIAPRAYPVKHDRFTAALMELDLGAYSSRSEIDKALGEKVSSWPIRQFLLKNLSYDPEAESYHWQPNLEVIHRHHDRLAAALELEEPISMETLFVRGEKSKYVTSSDLAQIWDLFPNAHVATVEGAGHWVHAEKPEEFANVVLEFLEAHIRQVAR